MWDPRLGSVKRCVIVWSGRVEACRVGLQLSRQRSEQECRPAILQKEP